MDSGAITLFLAGDVMTGRGVDQILPVPSGPRLHEPHVKDARDYVALAEAANGPIPAPVEPAWPWGDALRILDETAPDVRIINLETSVTVSSDYDRGKGIHYRMHPANIGCLTAARIDACALANNHVLDFGRPGLAETLATLAAAGLGTAGAGRNAAQAWLPATLPAARGRVLLWSVGMESSGVAPGNAAGPDRPGLAFLSGPSDESADLVLGWVQSVQQPGDLAVVSVHWGSNWGYAVPEAHVRFAHRLVDGGVDAVYGHSSHHPRPLETYRGRPVLYGCGDLVNDYEGIRGYEQFRDDLRLLYFLTFDARTHELRGLRLVPLQARRMRLQPAAVSDAEWLRGVLNDAGSRFGTRLDAAGDAMAVRLG
ncbi:CapA family protein [Arthrobacter sp. I2-34]|uniref:CapA family protein n=1 Tax=Arthrobacter hankyongi TaxID=2904801 RepID=A0ABS9LBL1_9MICC|nr:CapA family protein [Arthrobacter hankyongi]MCG2624045.1 CapA family protein [Arthrobacter hankyongi]